MIRNVYSEYVTICESIADTFVRMKFSKEFIGLNDDLYICCVSSHQAVQIIMCYMIAIFLDYLKTVITYSTKGKIGLIGDMNSRTSVNDDFIVDNFHPSVQD